MFYCPHCGEAVANDNAKMCPHCGSDDETGWREDIEYHSIEIPEWNPDEDSRRDRSLVPRKQRSAANKRAFLCSIAILAGLLMVTSQNPSRPRTIFSLMLIVSGGYGLLTRDQRRGR